MSKKIIYLDEYRKLAQQTSLRGKVVVGSDIRPHEVVDLAIEHRSLNIVSCDDRKLVAEKILNNKEIQGLVQNKNKL